MQRAVRLFQTFTTLSDVGLCPSLFAFKCCQKSLSRSVFFETLPPIHDAGPKEVLLSRLDDGATAIPEADIVGRKSGNHISTCLLGIYQLHDEGESNIGRWGKDMQLCRRPKHRPRTNRLSRRRVLRGVEHQRTGCQDAPTRPTAI